MIFGKNHYIYMKLVSDVNLRQFKTLMLETIYPIGAIIQSTTLDTEQKVIAKFGGTSWRKIEGRFLIGQGASTKTGQTSKTTYGINETGGEEYHKLTTTEMPSHNHGITALKDDSGGYFNYILCGGDEYNVGFPGSSTQNAGGNGAHNNLPPYKAVYIWERTA